MDLGQTLQFLWYTSQNDNIILTFKSEVCLRFFIWGLPTVIQAV